MKYFFPDGTGLTLDEIRSQVESGDLDESRFVIPEGSNDAVQIQSLLVKRDSTPPPLPRQTFASASPPPVPVGGMRSTPASQQKQGSLAWLWITLSILVVLVLFAVSYGIFAFAKLVNTEIAGEQADVPLLEDRIGHETKWLDRKEIDFEASGPVPDPPEDEALKLIKYQSPVGDLAAFISPDPGDGKRHPAMVWAKGGFGGIGDFMWGPQHRLDDQSAREFRDAGIVLMCPSFRGENDNPGLFEFFYGEVDDLLAAVEHVKTLPYVDPERVYIGGHSIGGTLVLLAAVSGSETSFRAAFSFGGRPDLDAVMIDGEGYGNTPYDYELYPRETELRNPIRYTKFITSPTFYIEGEEDYYYDADTMVTRAKDAGVPFQALSIDSADHWSVLASSTRLIAQKILKDTGPTCNIKLTAGELNTAWAAMNDISLATELSKWLANSGTPEDLDVILENLDFDGYPQNSTDIDRLKSAVNHLIPINTTDSMLGLSDLIDLGYEIESESVQKEFDKEILPVFHQYLRDISASKTKYSEEEAQSLLWIVMTLNDIGTEESGRLVCELIAADFCKEHPSGWDDVFDTFTEDSEAFSVIDGYLRKNPPAGAVGYRLLSWNNSLFFDEESVEVHYYDSAPGLAILENWLKPPEEDANPKYAFSSALALGFFEKTDNQAALEMAYNYPDDDVQMEAAWADVKSNKSPKGLKFLQDAALDLERSATAKQYLIELDHESDIPEKALAPDFAAKVEMVDWLKHPNELGGLPDSIKIFDTRELYWPPSEEKRKLYLFEFTYRFKESEPLQTSYGIYGGNMTWSSFLKYETTPTPEAIYVHHCALELNWLEDDNESTPSKQEALRQLKEKNEGQFLDTKIED